MINNSNLSWEWTCHTFSRNIKSQTSLWFSPRLLIWLVISVHVCFLVSADTPWLNFPRQRKITMLSCQKKIKPKLTSRRWYERLITNIRAYFKTLYSWNDGNLTKTYITDIKAYSLRMMYLFLFTASKSTLTSVKENRGLALNPPFTPATLNSSSSSRQEADMASPLLRPLLFLWQPTWKGRTERHYRGGMQEINEK